MELEIDCGIIEFESDSCAGSGFWRLEARAGTGIWATIYQDIVCPE